MTGSEFLAGLYDAFGRGDVESVLGAMDPEIRWHEAESHPYMPTGEPWIGPEAIVSNLFTRLSEEWDGYTVSPHTYHDAGGVVSVEGRYTAVHKETGESLDAQFCHVWTLENGRITKFQQYSDTAQLQKVMGARSD